VNIDKKASWPPPGHYVVAVSAGVDSMSLLDLLAAYADAKNWQLEVAHFNHGWTDAAGEYLKMVRSVAKKHGLPFHYDNEKVAANEADAREARYRWLREVKDQTGAEAIITAHHHDDLIETVVLNLQRGTGRRGLTPFGSTPDVVRPLVDVAKAELVDYAKSRDLKWVEDPTNTDTRLRRNAVRHELLPELRRDPEFDRELEKIIEEAAELNARIDESLESLVKKGEGSATVSIGVLRRMPLATLAEMLVMMANVARPGTELDRRTVEALAVDIKTGRNFASRQLTKRLFASRSHDTVSIAFTP